MMPAVPTMHGMPSCRAMIAVWLVEPPRSVTRPTQVAGSRPAVSEGARSTATMTAGSSGAETPGSGSPTRWATTRRSMSPRSVARSAIRPPIAVKISTNCATAARTLGTRAVPPLTDVATAPRNPLSRASPALAVSTSWAGPVVFAALALNDADTADAASS